jgi:thiol-disulfide isomerase/thioredoxin
MIDAASRLAVLMVLAGSVAGCSRSEPASADVEPQDRVEPNSAVVTIVDRAGYDAVLVSLQGQVVLVDCWATWCLPCLEQLPHTLELAQRDPQLAVVTLCFDDPDKLEQISKVLTAKGGGDRGRHLVSKNGSSSDSMKEFEITSGALPHYKLYDRTGKLRHVFELDLATEKQFTTSDTEAAVDELLGEAMTN